MPHEDDKRAYLPSQERIAAERKKLDEARFERKRDKKPSPPPDSLESRKIIDCFVREPGCV